MIHHVAMLQMKENPGGSLGDNLFKMPELSNLEDLIEYLKTYRGYDYSNSFSMIDLIKDKYVAEMGCGHGYISAAISCEVKELDGFDVDEIAIKKAKDLRDKYSIRNLNFFLFDGYNTNKPTNSYDVVISADVLEHVPDPKKYLNECYRVLRDNGLLILTTPNGLIAKKNERIIKSHSPYHITEFTPSELEKLITSSNFKMLKTYRKVNIVNNGYRLTSYKEFIYKFLPSKLINLALKVKGILIKQTGQSKDSYADYRLFYTSLGNITAKNCDVIVVVATK